MKYKKGQVIMVKFYCGKKFRPIVFNGKLTSKGNPTSECGKFGWPLHRKLTDKESGV